MSIMGATSPMPKSMSTSSTHGEYPRVRPRGGPPRWSCPRHPSLRSTRRPVPRSSSSPGRNAASWTTVRSRAASSGRQTNSLNPARIAPRIACESGAFSESDHDRIRLNSSESRQPGRGRPRPQRVYPTITTSGLVFSITGKRIRERNRRALGSTASAAKCFLHHAHGFGVEPHQTPPRRHQRFSRCCARADLPHIDWTHPSDLRPARPRALTTIASVAVLGESSLGSPDITAADPRLPSAMPFASSVGDPSRE